MNTKIYISAVLLLAVATIGYSSESAKVSEHATLETVRELVVRNEKLINPIKMEYTVKNSRKGERPEPIGGAMRLGRRYSHSNCIWAQDGEKHFARVDYFYGPNEPAGSTAYVFDAQITTRGKLPDLIQGTIGSRDTYDWYNVMVAKLGLRPFEGRYRLSEILVPEYASLHDETEILNSRETYVVDAGRPIPYTYFARIWIDKQQGMPLRIFYFDKHPTWDDARLMSEINDIEPHQLENGAWIPVRGVRSIHFSDGFISYEHMSVDVNSIKIQREDIPESLFVINFPDGARIYNATSGLTTIVGQPLQTYEQVIQAGGSFIAGAVVDANDVPVPEVVIAPYSIITQQNDSRSLRSIQPHERNCAITNSKGRFALELEQQGLYELWFFPKEFVDTRIRDVPLGEHNLKVTLDKGGTVTGRLVRMTKGTKIPLANAQVTAEAGDPVIAGGMRYARTRAITDEQGRFQFRCLPTQMRDRASGDSQEPQYVPMPWNIRCGPVTKTILFDEGIDAQEVELVLKPDPLTAPSLIGRKLPGFDGIKINIDTDQTQDKMMLVCFFDMNQRPARNCIIQLSKRAQELTAQDVIIVGIQAADVDTEAFNKWIKASNFDFPIGIIQANLDEIKFNWSVQALPWLILTDKEKIIQAENFALEELDERIKEADGGKL